ncbi:MAG: DUF465 domain-containing protein [Acidobacteriota bacterium]
MELAEPEIRNLLLDKSEEFQHLSARHREFESRLEQLSRKHPPSEQERLEQIELKKRKLLLKDRMASMIREHAHENEFAPAH